MTVRFKHSIPTNYFEAMYAANPDPWHFASSQYEKEKYAATLAALTAATLQARSRSWMLDRRFHASNLRSDARPCWRSIRSRTHLIEREWPVAAFPRYSSSGAEPPISGRPVSFDLIVLSEMVYYLDRGEYRKRWWLAFTSSMAPGGDIVLVHWLGGTHYPLSGDDAATFFLAVAEPLFKPIHQSRTAEYRLDVLPCLDGRATKHLKSQCRRRGG